MVRQRGESLRVEKNGLEKKKKKEQTNNILNEGRIKNKNKNLAFSYSAQPYIDVHCSNVGKKFTYTTTTIATLSLYIMVPKIVF